MCSQPSISPLSFSYEWLNEEKTWCEYDDKTKLKIKKHLEEANGQSQSLFVEIFQKWYEIEFKQKIQINCETAKIRPIRAKKIKKDVLEQKCSFFNTVPFSLIIKTNKEGQTPEMCSLCLEIFTENDDIVQLNECNGHFFHAQCKDSTINIGQYVETNHQCPVCKKIYGQIEGNMPEDGKMKVMKISSSLAGYEGHGTIVIEFIFYRTSEHHADHRLAYLPNNEEGNRVLLLICKAWEKRVLFTIGYSLSRNRDNCIILNGFHLKTSNVKNDPWGYPDSSYIGRVINELRDKGIVD